MPEFVRVRAENGYNVTVSREFAEANGLEPLNPDRNPASDRNGRALLEEPGTPTAEKKAAAAEKEQTR